MSLGDWLYLLLAAPFVASTLVFLGGVARAARRGRREERVWRPADAHTSDPEDGSGGAASFSYLTPGLMVPDR